MDDRDRDTNLTTADLAHAAEQNEHGPSSSATVTQASEQGTARSSGTAAAVVPVKSREQSSPLFADTEAGSLRSRWETIQVAFVDEPRSSVQQADQLVAEVIKRLVEQFASERRKLEDQWGRGDNVSTEDLRIALRKYRSFFERLLAV